MTHVFREAVSAAIAGRSKADVCRAAGHRPEWWSSVMRSVEAGCCPTRKLAEFLDALGVDDVARAELLRLAVPRGA
jgi:hypothetical protein